MEPGTLLYRCNVCGGSCRTKIGDLSRETPSCPGCGSTVRMRAMVHVLSLELFGRSVPLPDFPERPDLRGMGLSDWDGYAIPLARKLGYTNTYYHREPRLDITAIDPALEGTLDFLIATDVFEHIVPPVSVAFGNALRLLKPSGTFVFSVPYTHGSSTREHFPELNRWEFLAGRRVLRNITRDGREQLFEDLVFHGGEGETLEMRVFSEGSLLEEFSRAGFTRVRIHREPCFEHGIYWPQDWSLPIGARK